MRTPRNTYVAHVNEVDFVVDVRYVNLMAVGGGSYGLVCSATDTTTGNQVAIKKASSRSSAAHARPWLGTMASGAGGTCRSAAKPEKEGSGSRACVFNRATK